MGNAKPSAGEQGAGRPSALQLEQRAFARQWGLLGLAVLIFAAMLAWYLHSLHTSIDTMERERLATQAKVVDENLAAQLGATNRALDSIRTDLPYLSAQKNGPELINRRLQTMSDAMPGVRILIILDAQGTATASNWMHLVGETFGEREYFQEPLRVNNGALLHVSPPFKSDMGVFAVTLAKVITGRHAEFLGVVAATLDTGYFSTLLGSIRYAPDMGTSLAHADGVPFLTMPEPAGADAMESVPSGSFYARHLASGQRVTVMTGPSDLAGAQRLMVQRTVMPTGIPMDQPLRLAVSRDLSSIFADWRQDAYLRGFVFAVLALLSAWALYSHQKRQQVLNRSERARRVDAEQLRMLYESDLVGLTITSQEKGWIRINQYLCNMLEYSEQELRGMTWAQLTHPDDLQADAGQFDKLLANEINGYRLEKRFISRSGKIIPVNLVVRCIRKEGAAVDFVIAMVEDITEQKQAETAIRESQERYRTLIEWTPEAIIVHRVGTILYVNPAAIRLFSARSADDMVGRMTRDLIHPDFQDQQTRRMHSIIKKDAIEPKVESRFLKLDGTPFDVEVQGTAIVFEGETAIHVSVRDITERKQLENQVRQLAFFDPLTLLPNRRLLDDRLKQCMAGSKRHSVHGALMFLDLDNFKPLNDAHGHGVGDLLLIEVGRRLTACVREMDTVARFGGDEFVVLLNELSEDWAESTAQALGVAEKIRATLSEPFRLSVDSQEATARMVEHHCSVSIGIVVFMNDEMSLDEALKRADAAMYVAKDAGRNTIALYGATDQRDVALRTA